ncbi:MAG: hypothetical protein OXC25_01460 [Thiotrichales bacterium]|nr:hypothetical protein [Thiotrichales bacterium]MCY4348503.1 hypothetical protein [Thiotrichales bacterium]
MPAEDLDAVLDGVGSKWMFSQTALSVQESGVDQGGMSAHDGDLKKDVAATARGAEIVLDWSTSRGVLLKDVRDEGRRRGIALTI